MLCSYKSNLHTLGAYWTLSVFSDVYHHQSLYLLGRVEVVCKAVRAASMHIHQTFDKVEVMHQWCCQTILPLRKLKALNNLLISYMTLPHADDSHVLFMGYRTLFDVMEEVTLRKVCGNVSRVQSVLNGFSRLRVLDIDGVENPYAVLASLGHQELHELHFSTFPDRNMPMSADYSRLFRSKLAVVDHPEDDAPLLCLSVNRAVDESEVLDQSPLHELQPLPITGFIRTCRFGNIDCAMLRLYHIHGHNASFSTTMLKELVFDRVVFDEAALRELYNTNTLRSLTLKECIFKGTVCRELLDALEERFFNEGRHLDITEAFVVLRD